MQLILRPVSDARLKEIIVTDSRFAIGRNEAHFEDYDSATIAKLSRQHARIFERDDGVFIADLNSSNGTTVNGQAVEGEPVQLNLNDEVQFGGLLYRVEHVGRGGTRSVADQSPTDAKIVLTPASGNGALDPIVVSRFPFLVSRYSNVFSRYKETAPDQLSLISKNHAKIFLRQNTVYVEDLGSTNGTYVSGEQLTDQPMRLANNDVVAFGGDHFTYRVQVFVGEGTIAEADAQIDKLSEGTIFVDDATNFFEVYMGAGEGEGGEQGAPADGDGEADAEAGTRILRKPPGRVRRFLLELRASLRGGAPIDRGLRWTVLASAAALTAAAGG